MKTVWILAVTLSLGVAVARAEKADNGANSSAVVEMAPTTSPAPVVPPSAAAAVVPATQAPTAAGPRTSLTANSTAKPATVAMNKSSERVPAQVLKIDKRRDRVSITDDPVHAWMRRDSVCVFRVGRALACGKVIAVGIRGAVVQLTGHAANVKPGDEVRYFEPDKRIPEITDEQLDSEYLMEAKPFKYTVAVGYNLSLDLRHPIAHFYWSVSPTIAVGLQPAYVRRTGNGGGTLTGYGGLLTVSYFGQEYFRGMWAMFGSGFYRYTVNSNGVSASANTPVLNLTLGWREDWAHGLNIGAALGARFSSPLGDGLTDIEYKTWYPIGLVEVGISF